MHRLAHHVSGGLIVALPGRTRTTTGHRRPPFRGVDRAQRHPVREADRAARFVEDLTASYQAGWYSVISLHGGGSPDAMKMEIFRNYPLGSKVDLVERMLDRGVLADATRRITRNRQPGRCCAAGCQMTELPAAATAPLPAPPGCARPAAAAPAEPHTLAR